MLLRQRPPDIDSSPVQLRQGLDHLDQGWLAVLRWLNACKLDYVVVGPVAHAIRGDVTARGPVAIVPAPYGRNFERLANALVARHAGLRGERRTGTSDTATVPIKLTADKLARGRRWMLRFSGYDLDVEGAGQRAAGARDTPDGAARAPHYQELLYESGRFTLADDLTVEVASPEDLEHFSHVRRTGTAPEFRVTRTPAGVPSELAEADREEHPEPPGTEDHGADAPGRRTDA